LFIAGNGFDSAVVPHEKCVLVHQKRLYYSGDDQIMENGRLGKVEIAMWHLSPSHHHADE
jgi:hypothetical protein